MGILKLGFRILDEPNGNPETGIQDFHDRNVLVAAQFQAFQSDVYACECSSRPVTA